MSTVADLYQLAVSCHQKGDLPQAETLYRQVLGSNPGHTGALHLLGVLANQRGDHEAGIPLIRQAIALNPSAALFHTNLGVALVEKGQLAEGVESLRQAFRLNPNNVDAYQDLGKGLFLLGELLEAAECFRQALRINPNQAELHDDLGKVFVKQGLPAEAAQSFERALRLDPRRADTHNNLGNLLFEQGRHADATSAFRQALHFNPNHVNAHISLGVIFTYEGQLVEARACFAKALEIQPNNVSAHGNLIMTLHHSPGQDRSTLLAECRRWHERHAQPLARFIKPPTNDRLPERRLRIGYVSGYLNQYPVGRFMLPLLTEHDRARFEIFCYSSVKQPDSFTQLCRARTDGWREIDGSADEQVAQLIRDDRIDILVDLAMHTANNALLIFARKPAPVQVTYLAYCSTTGLDTMDYRLTDPFLDPPGENERFYSEKSSYLPETYWCYQPVSNLPPTTLPALKAGLITFGCLNCFAKVSVPTLEAWGLLLQALPSARLLLYAPPGSRQRVLDILARSHVAGERLEFTDSVPIDEYFQLYQRIDVALDPFPYGGGTTTCDALWMGVPVVSLAGETGVGRGGVSILSNMGLTDLLAPDVAEYVRIALELAGDQPRLSELRATLRDRMRKSPLMDAPRFTRNVEAAYREMWRNWCALPAS